MEKFAPRNEIMGFLERLCKDGSVGIVCGSFSFKPKEIKRLIEARTPLGRRLYRQVEVLYEAHKAEVGVDLFCCFF